MKLNNKGFAVSIVLYSVSAIIIIVLLLILTVDATIVHNTRNQSDKIKEELSGLNYND